MRQNAFKNLYNILPLLFFGVIFFGISLAVRDFYAVPILVAFALTAVVSFFVYKKNGFERNLEIFCQSAGDINIILMVIIFLLAGCFGEIAKEIGAINAVINFCLAIMPIHLVAASLFIICSFISISMGSSMGTVIAIAPIAVGLAAQTALSIELLLGAVLGGAIFGDNLSTISDTTIAAVRTQGCSMGDKFRQNFLIVAPAAVLTIFIYCWFQADGSTTQFIEAREYQFIKMLPYLFVLGGALLRMNVFILLFLGIVIASTIGLVYSDFSSIELLKIMHRGMIEIEDLSVLSVIAAGTAGLIKANGGLDAFIGMILGFINTSKSAQYGIAFLASVVDLITANNTIAIVVAGPIAKELSLKYNITAKRSASILDIFASAWQGIIPYGAQILAAVGFAKISPLALVPYNIYSYLIMLAGVVAIYFDLPDRLLSKENKELVTFQGENIHS